MRELTKDELLVCDELGISPEEYLRQMDDEFLLFDDVPGCDAEDFGLSGYAGGTDHETGD
ncbi:MAG: hypothetical protein RBS05_21465 [Zoogloea oleivorans]|jgi:hypothetical protein|uniref:hypothetical protein n=1 Tax=Zoogloea oleivorans TaxID=1552750 RepID=UPI002A35898F|nr:hypothetical protein [Zoogloea oleivorans]MDY0038482.1 hypothetical protein [Zoogloea oleivorans]